MLDYIQLIYEGGLSSFLQILPSGFTVTLNFSAAKEIKKIGTSSLATELGNYGYGNST